VVTQSDDLQAQQQLEAAGAEVIRLPAAKNGADLPALMDHLAQREINEVLIEAGATLAGAALAAGVVDELLIYAAPHIMGSEARGLFDIPGLSRMQERIELDITDLRMVGKDIRITARPKNRNATD
jgi:diaminohydroxyphosphoribosylaminopyrimidine deaminase/5-amino-6-(5-phosphoribosylamino)uracil reductase